MSKSLHKKLRGHEHPAKRCKVFIAIMIVLMVGIAAAVTLLRGTNGGFDVLKGRRKAVLTMVTAITGPILTRGFAQRIDGHRTSSAAL